ncbi:MAG: helix-turn-helix transcriptional regulator [Brevibacterium aurantiacum]|uniref:helix-turn-helix transcriptional regulator n=1 Tax=Brevibacterium aurantiacum TaxID=273384 RepID=UPI003F8E7BC3
MTAQPKTDRLVYVDEFASMIDRSPSAARYLIHKGDAPKSAKVGGRRVFKESEIWAWINSKFEEAK